MAAIDTYLQDIVDAVYGEEVRWSIHDAISAMNVESTTAEAAAISAQNSAAAKASEASTSATNAAASATSAAASAAEAEQYAQGGLVYQATISFSQIPVSGMKKGWMYDINEDFTTDSRFQEGSGKSVKAGTNIAWNGSKWDILAMGGIVVDAAISSTSENPVQNKVINSALGGKVDKVSGKGLSTNDYDNTSKTKLDGLANVKQIGTGLTLDSQTGELTASGAQVTIDSAMSTSSVNPLQNKVITAALANGNIKFGIDSQGNYGYIKAGADTVTPFKNPTGTKYDTYTTNGTYTPDVENYATHNIVVAVPGGTPTLQSKTVSPTTAELTVLPDSGYDGLSSVIVNPVSLQSKSANIVPTANWSGAWTTPYAINPDSGYVGMSMVAASVPMCRDHMLFSVTATETPSTVYTGDTSQSNTEKMLRIASTKSGMVYLNSYLNLPASSYMGNATAADVASGKTFSSAAGIQVTGTGNLLNPQPTRYVTPHIVSQTILPESGYNSLSEVCVYAISPIKDQGNITISTATTFGYGWYNQDFTVTPSSVSYEKFFALTRSHPREVFTLSSGTKINNFMIICFNLDSATAGNQIQLNNDPTTGLWNNIGNNSSYMSGSKATYGDSLLVYSASATGDMLFIGYPGDVFILQ